MVAPSYQFYTMLSEPFAVNGKMYVRIQHPKTGNARQARWYTPEEYRKAFPEAKVENEVEDTYFKPQKNVLGFTEGYITIFKYEESEDTEEFFKQSPARYAKWWGWYLPSGEKLDKLPSGVEEIKLEWTAVGEETGRLKQETAVKEAVERILYSNGEYTSFWVGEIGERLEKTLFVTKSVPIQNDYGASTLHVMEDPDGNQYTWVTSSKTWPAGSLKLVRGTVKSHYNYKGVQTTGLTRCQERSGK